MNDARLSLDEIHSLVLDCLRRHGCDEENAGAVASVITDAERDGCHSHGLMRLAGYVAALDSGKVKGDARPLIGKKAPAIIHVDGNGGFAPLALTESRPHIIEAAKMNGIAAAGLVNVYHFSALWWEIETLAEAGLCAFACTSYIPVVLPAGGKQALYGTNPIAFGWPRNNEPPVVFDQASSVMARGEVMLAAREGKKLADGVGVDMDGNPSNDPNEVLRGAMLAFGGYKGSLIAMMVELLAGPLIGETLSFETAAKDNSDGGPTCGGELILAMDPNLIGTPDLWADHGEKLFKKILSQNEVRLPGDRRYNNRPMATKDGVLVSSKILDEIKSL
ncbi:MAG: Ldh family oxidoreductase [Marinicaulis sp.]|nr:Ldh family oxidoreductase [Marinicaulis sp.]